MQSTNNYMNQEQFEQVLEYIPRLKSRKWKTNDIRFLFKILRYCALRPIEGIMLAKEDFNLTDRKINLGQTKTNPNAYAIIPRSFIDELSQYLLTKRTGRLFVGLTYHPMYKWCKRMGKDMGIESWNTPQSETREKTVGHIGRKSIGKDMIYGKVLDFQNQKINITTISMFMRHKSVTITQDKYLKETQEQVRQTL